MVSRLAFERYGVELTLCHENLNDASRLRGPMSGRRLFRVGRTSASRDAVPEWGRIGPASGLLAGDAATRLHAPRNLHWPWAGRALRGSGTSLAPRAGRGRDAVGVFTWPRNTRPVDSEPGVHRRPGGPAGDVPPRREPLSRHHQQLRALLRLVR